MRKPSESNHSPFQRPPIVTELGLDSLEPGKIHRMRVTMTENATGNETLLPAVVLRAQDPKPVVGVTAVIHGNELNGIPVIHRLLSTLNETALIKGTVVAVPIVNVPGYMRKQREFEDGVDLNRIMPGSAGGDESQFYAARFMDRVAREFDYLIDLHTASAGRVNSLYVRADMSKPEIAKMARLISPQIIVHSPEPAGSLRGACADRVTVALTVEVGDPQRLQRGLVRAARLGIQEVLEDLGMIPNVSDTDDDDIIECKKSYWIYSDRGGFLNVLPKLADTVEEGEVIARLFNVWGDMVREYLAPEKGIVVGKSTDPAARAGSRIMHLGIVGKL